MLKVLFDRSGELRKSEFLKGCLLLFTAQVIILMGAIWFTANMNLGLNRFLFLLPLLMLLYPYYCLYGKRLDALNLNRLWFGAIALFLVVTYFPLMALGTLNLTHLPATNLDLLRAHPLITVIFLGFIPYVIITNFAAIATGLFLGLWKRPATPNAKLITA